jgi:ubiquinone/menaquinone biosynthesis C-methylase UbiE
MTGFALSNNTAFDAIAEEYDHNFTHSRIGNLQRSQVWEEIGCAFSPGDRILELGCGTGHDALQLTKAGISVIACDASPEMIRVARRNASLAGFNSIEFKVCSNENLGEFYSHDKFDGAFSNFGSLNCSRSFRTVAEALATKIHPGGRLLLCLLGPCCLWEFAWFLIQGNIRKAFRRFLSGGTDAQIGKQTVRVLYPSPRTLRKAFAPEFRLVRCYGIGVAIPPSYTEHFFQRHPRTLLALAVIDKYIRNLPLLCVLGDHMLLEFVRLEP